MRLRRTVPTQLFLVLAALAPARAVLAASDSGLRYQAPLECPSREVAVRGIQFHGNPPGVRDGLLTIVKQGPGFSVSMRTDLDGQLLTDAMTVDTCEGAVRWGVFVWNSLFHRPIVMETTPDQAKMVGNQATIGVPTLSLGLGGVVNPSEAFRPGAEAVVAADFRWARLGIEGAYLMDRAVHNEAGQGTTVSGHSWGAHLCGAIGETSDRLRLGFCGNVKANWIQFKLDEDPAVIRGFWADAGLSVLARLKLVENLALEGTVGGGWVPRKMKPEFPLGGIGYEAPETYTELGLRLTVVLPMLAGGNVAPSKLGALVGSTSAVAVAQ